MGQDRPYVVVAALVGVVLASPALATDEKSPAATTENRSDAFRRRPGGLIETGWLIDRPVRDAQRKERGKITDVWFDPKSAAEHHSSPPASPRGSAPNR